MRTREQIMLEWDEIRRSIANGCANDGPRLWFEGILDDADNARSAALEEAAKVIDDNAEGSDGSKRILVPRNDGNLAGLGYAAAIRALKEGARKP